MLERATTIDIIISGREKEIQKAMNYTKTQTKKLKSNYSKGSNRDKFDIAMAILEKWTIFAFVCANNISPICNWSMLV